MDGFDNELATDYAEVHEKYFNWKLTSESSLPSLLKDLLANRECAEVVAKRFQNMCVTYSNKSTFKYLTNLLGPCGGTVQIPTKEHMGIVYTAMLARLDRLEGVEPSGAVKKTIEQLKTEWINWHKETGVVNIHSGVVRM